jgi:hypothetical protein
MNISIPTVCLTIRIYDQDGGPVPGTYISAKLSTIERYKGYIIPEEYTGVTDESGVCVIKVFPNELGTEGSEYRIKMRPPSGKSVTLYATVPNTDCNLEDICDLEPYAVRGSGEIITAQVMSSAESARQAAQEARSDAQYVQVNINTATEGARRAETAREHAETQASIATAKAGVAEVKASFSASSAEAACVFKEMSKAWAESHAEPDPDNSPGSKSAKAWAEQAGHITQNLPVTATATTTARTLADRFADVINVKDFGAAGNGVIDDTNAINSAVARAVERNAAIHFPSGRYKILGIVESLLTVPMSGDGIIVSGTDEFYASNKPEHTNTIYVSVDGGGDGLSVSSPLTIQDAWLALRTVGYLRGFWVVQCAAGIYQTGMQFTNVTVEDRNGLVIQGVDPDRAKSEYADAWPTQFIPYTTKDYSNIMSFYSVTNIGVKNIWFKNDINITNGTCVAFAYGCQRAFINNCCVTNGTWCGVIFQNIQYGSISNCIVDSNDKTKCLYGVNSYNSFVNSNSEGLTRNTIKEYAVGFFAQGGRSYVHNDYNDFISCGTAIGADSNAHIGNNYNTFSMCTVTQEHMFGAEGVVPSVSDIGIIRAAFGALSARDDPGVACWPGVFVYSSGTRGRFSMFENVKNRSLFHRLLINFGDNDINSTVDSNLQGQAVFYNTTDASLGLTYVNPTSINKYYSTGSNQIAKESFSATYENYSLSLGSVTSFIVNANSIGSGVDNVHSCGSGSRRFSVVYAASGSINTSDAREKQQVHDYNDIVLDAWGEVQFKSFLFNDAVDQKGDNARIHAGVIAQQVIEAFAKHGLDATHYALLCYDKWEDEYEDIEVIDQEAVTNEESGEIEQERKTHVERKLTIQAGDRYGIRYEEALCIEAAYQRRRADRLEARIVALEAAIKPEV